jgi:hypothetical protein
MVFAIICGSMLIAISNDTVSCHHLKDGFNIMYKDQYLDSQFEHTEP